MKTFFLILNSYELPTGTHKFILLFSIKRIKGGFNIFDRIRLSTVNSFHTPFQYKINPTPQEFLTLDTYKVLKVMYI